MAYTDYDALLINHCIKSDLGRHLNNQISGIVIDDLIDNSYGHFYSAYAARKAINILSFKPAAKIFLFNGDFYVVDLCHYKILKHFVSFVCSLDFSDNDIEFSYIESYFFSIVRYYSSLYKVDCNEVILNPSPLPDFIDDELPF